MKKFWVLIFTFALASLSMGQDSSSGQETMENADMSDGTTHWHGDCKAAGSDMMTWTIQYIGLPPAFDQATPALRLATAAAYFAE